jgi:hypothetical protein
VTQALTTDGLGTARTTDARERDRARASVLRELLGYVSPHRGYALLTVAFGLLGLLLSFAYPWIIGSVVDLAGTEAPRS